MFKEVLISDAYLLAAGPLLPFPTLPHHFFSPSQASKNLPSTEVIWDIFSSHYYFCFQFMLVQFILVPADSSDLPTMTLSLLIPHRW